MSEAAQLALFYAQSWALAHMVKFSPAFSHRFAQFLASLAEGKSVLDSFGQVYGKNLAVVTADLSHYVPESSFRTYPASNRNMATESGSEMEQSSSVTLKPILGDLLPTLRRFDVVRPMLETLAAEHPHAPQVKETMANSAGEAVLRREVALDPEYSDAQQYLASPLPLTAKLEPAAGSLDQGANIKGVR